MSEVELGHYYRLIQELDSWLDYGGLIELNLIYKIPSDYGYLYRLWLKSIPYTLVSNNLDSLVEKAEREGNFSELSYLNTLKIFNEKIYDRKSVPDDLLDLYGIVDCLNCLHKQLKAEYSYISSHLLNRNNSVSIDYDSTFVFRDLVNCKKPNSNRYCTLLVFVKDWNSENILRSSGLSNWKPLLSSVCDNIKEEYILYYGNLSSAGIDVGWYNIYILDGRIIYVHRVLNYDQFIIEFRRDFMLQD